MKSKISSDWDKGLRKRKLFAKLCKLCENEFWVPKHVLLKSLYCSRKCCDADSSAIEVECSLCHKKFLKDPCKIKVVKSGLFFCSRNCKDEGQQIDNGITEIWPNHYGDGESSYRIRAFRKYGKKCSHKECGYDADERMLDVHHIDSNRQNNKLDNLEVLCVWCHALITRKII